MSSDDARDLGFKVGIQSYYWFEDWTLVLKGVDEKYQGLLLVTFNSQQTY